MTTAAIPEIDFADLIKRLVDLVTPRSDDIFTSAAKLGELLSICVELAELEPVIRQKATALALAKKDVAGWTVVHRDGNSYVAYEDIVKLALRCPVIYLQNFVTVLATQLGNSSELKYRTLCETARIEPDQEVIKQTGATVFLRRNLHSEIHDQPNSKS
jgi:hypothetical protein